MIRNVHRLKSLCGRKHQLSLHSFCAFHVVQLNDSVKRCIEEQAVVDMKFSFNIHITGVRYDDIRP